MSRFQTTRWSLIAHAADQTDALARPALEQLCRSYRPPVLAYIRHCGHASADAEDLAQAFFLRFIERAWYSDADPRRGRFRSLLLASLRHFLSDAQAQAGCDKRGGRLRAVALDPDALMDPAGSPEQAFDRAWLATIMTRASGRLQQEWRLAGKGAQFEQLIPLLADGRSGQELRELASRIDARSNTLSVQLHRMRARLRQLVRLELLQTVDSREALEAELTELRTVLGVGA